MSSKHRPKKIALVHDYLREYGGAERVLEELHNLFPEARVYTAFIDQKSLGRHWQRFADWDLTETWLARVPLIKSLYSPLRLLASKAFRDLDLSEYDLVISSSNAYQAKAVRARAGCHYCYCHTPPRSLYGYTTLGAWRSRWLTRLVGEMINHLMRVIDFNNAQKVDVFIANSEETARRIAKFYRRESQVIYPPIKVPKTPPAKSQRDYFLYVNRLALAKHPELAVAACLELGLPLKVVGTGPMQSQLEELVANFSRGFSKTPSKNQSNSKQRPAHQIEFLGSVSDEELAELYRGARALLYPVEDEDLGMVPLEAMGYGVPVLAHASGGPLETVLDGQTGLFFGDLSQAGLVGCLSDFLKKESGFDHRAIHSHARKFEDSVFRKKILKLVGAQ